MQRILMDKSEIRLIKTNDLESYGIGGLVEVTRKKRKIKKKMYNYGVKIYNKFIDTNY